MFPLPDLFDELIWIPAPHLLSCHTVSRNLHQEVRAIAMEVVVMINEINTWKRLKQCTAPTRSP